MSGPASKKKIVIGKRNAKIKSVARDESFLREPNNTLQGTFDPLRILAGTGLHIASNAPEHGR
jgi:hypothetical protein